MSRPKQHDDHTAVALLDAAECIAERDGVAALSVRRVANEVGTTTRAVYSLFGSKDGLVTALGARAFDLLGVTIAELPQTPDPKADLVEAGLAFRCFALEHPVLFRIGVQRLDASGKSRQEIVVAASRALAVLHDRIRRLVEVGQLGHRSVAVAALEFHALCEGLAAMEARCLIRGEGADRIWRGALSALISGWSRSDQSHESSLR